MVDPASFDVAQLLQGSHAHANLGDGSAAPPPDPRCVCRAADGAFLACRLFGKQEDDGYLLATWKLGQPIFQPLWARKCTSAALARCSTFWPGKGRSVSSVPQSGGSALCPTLDGAPSSHTVAAKFLTSCPYAKTSNCISIHQ